MFHCLNLINVFLVNLTSGVDYYFISLLANQANIFKWYSKQIGINFFCNESDFNFFFKNKNSNLQNYIAFYHPNFLYFFLTGLAYFYVLRNIQYNSINNYKYLIVSIILSSIWSYQEVLWNGFWNWDNIEMSLLNIVITMYFLYHSKKSLESSHIYYILLLISVYIYFINKTNLISSQHTFANSFLFSLDSHYYYPVIIFFFFKCYRFCKISNIAIVYFLLILIIFIYFSIKKQVNNFNTLDKTFQLFFHCWLLFVIFNNSCETTLFSLEFFYVSLNKKIKIYKIKYSHFFVTYLYFFLYSFVKSKFTGNQLNLISTVDLVYSHYTVLNNCKTSNTFFFNFNSYYFDNVFLFFFKSNNLELFYFIKINLA